MSEKEKEPHPSSPERNPLGLGSRGPESNTGSTADTSYNARGADPYLTGEPNPSVDEPSRSLPADPDVPSSDEP